MRRLLAALALALLAGCAAPVVTVGSKPFAENRILAEMFALLLEDEGLRVQRRIPVGETEAVFAALQADGLDVYPEYVGTALGLLGLPAIVERDVAWAEVQAAFQSRDMRFLPRLGFESRYAVVVTAARAAELGLERIEDLAPRAPALRLGVTATYARRPRDGLAPLLDRFGLAFEAVEIAPGSDRRPLYEGLLEGRLDVVVGFATDPQLEDYGLVALEAGAPFFPPYDAAPLVGGGALDRAPAIGEALARLAGRLDAAGMRALIREVEVEGRSPAEVAARALTRMGLVAGDAAPTRPPLLIAAEGATLGAPEANRALRAVRRALPRRGIAYLETPRPAAAIGARRARLALAPAIDQFRVVGREARLDPSVEAVAVAGAAVLHAVGRRDGPGLASAATLVTGPFGSPSHKTALVLAGRREAPPSVLTRPSAAEAAAAVAAGEADVMLLVAPPGRPDLARILAERPELRLLDAAAWWRGAARLALPFLREATIAAGLHPGQPEPVATVAMQLLLIGPAPPRPGLLGRQGPGAYSDAPRPLTDETVLAIDAELGPHAAVDPVLRRAAALTPEARVARARLVPRLDRALMSAALIAFLGWAGWLLVRP